MNKFQELKQWLKDNAKELTKLKLELKNYQRNHGGSGSTYHYEVDKLRHEWRHKHIAYCIMRGRTYEQIENPSSDNPANTTLIQRYIEEFTVERDEAIYAGA